MVIDGIVERKHKIILVNLAPVEFEFSVLRTIQCLFLQMESGIFGTRSIYSLMLLNTQDENPVNS